MKKAKTYLIFLTTLLFVVFSACSSKNSKKEEIIDVSQITYKEFYEMIFEDYENRVEWHHDRYVDEAKTSTSLSERGECEDKGCGNQVFVKNTDAQRQVKVIVNTSFSIPNTPEYLATEFTLKPGEERYLTCTKFCFNGENYKLDHEIVVAEFTED